MGPNVACGCRSYKNDDDIHAVEDRNQIYWSQLSAAAVGDNPSSSFARWADHVGDASVTTSLEHGFPGRSDRLQRDRQARLAVINDPQGASFIASQFVPENKDLTA